MPTQPWRGVVTEPGDCDVVASGQQAPGSLVVSPALATWHVDACYVDSKQDDGRRINTAHIISNDRLDFGIGF